MLQASQAVSLVAKSTTGNRLALPHVKDNKGVYKKIARGRQSSNEAEIVLADVFSFPSFQSCHLHGCGLFQSLVAILSKHRCCFKSLIPS
jgi:hypothetical protein